MHIHIIICHNQHKVPEMSESWTTFDIRLIRERDPYSNKFNGAVVFQRGHHARWKLWIQAHKWIEIDKKLIQWPKQYNKKLHSGDNGKAK